MNRASFSVYHVLSARLAQQLVVKDLLHDLLICWADTDPLVDTYALGGPRLRYADGKAKELEVAVPLVTTLRSGLVEHWDTAWSTTSANVPLPNRIKRAHAEASGAQYRLFDRRVFESNRTETKNRKSAQRVLYAGHDLVTEEAECRALLELVNEPKTISHLSAKLGKPETYALLVALRLWLQGRVTLPMTSSLMSAAWIVAGTGHGN